MRSQKLKEYIANALLIATSLALLWFFSCIWIIGSHYIQEPNIIILIMETAAVAAIYGFAIYNFIRMRQKFHKNIPPKEDIVVEMRSQKLKEYIANALLMATSLVLLWFFSYIWMEGRHYIQEPNIIILFMVTAAIAAIYGFAIYRFIRSVTPRT